MIILIICVSVVAIVFITEVSGKISSYNEKKLVEEHKTANLALAYQILSARPELSLKDVMGLIEMNEGKHTNLSEPSI